MRILLRSAAPCAFALAGTLLAFAPGLPAQVQPPAKAPVHQHGQAPTAARADTAARPRAGAPAHAGQEPAPAAEAGMQGCPLMSGAAGQMGGMGMRARGGMMHGMTAGDSAGGGLRGMMAHGPMHGMAAGDSAGGMGTGTRARGGMMHGMAAGDSAGMGMGRGTMPGMGAAMRARHQNGSPSLSPNPNPNPPSTSCPAVTSAQVGEGREIFTGRGNCFACHGAQARGTALAPSLVRPKWLHVDGTYASIARLVATGVPQPKAHPAPMPPLGGARLSDGERCAVAAYVYSLSRD